MITKPPMRKRSFGRGIAAPTLLLPSICLLLVSIGSGASHPQQDRQLTQTGSANATTAKRIALVIGNGAYTSAPPLKNPPNDARDMAATLKVLGFSVSSAIDADQRTMKRLIRDFGQQLKGGGQGLFYYAGHGVQMRGRNYLIPANADITSETDVEDQAVDLNLVLGLMDEAQNGLNIVILDACRNNPFSRSFRSASSGLAQVDAPTGTLIAYATSPGRVAGDGTGRNGLYTSELLAQMRVPGIGVEEMFKRVRGGVQRQTGGQQVPWESSSLVGNFYFSPSTVAETLATDNTAGRTTIDPVAFELSYWDTIKNSTSADDFKAYLEKYPNGQFASLARNRITSLEAASKPTESMPNRSENSATELAFWDSIKNSTIAGDYRAYLKRYPDGAFAELARNRLEPLEAAERAAAEPTRLGKSFKGYLGVMSAGFRARPGKLVISPEGIQFVWDKGRDGLDGDKPFTFPQDMPEDPRPFVLGCANFAKARTDDAFIREISKKNVELIDVIGEGGFVARFKATSPADAASALAAVREACSNRPSSEKPSENTNSLEGTTWKGGSSGGDKQYEFQFLPNGEVVWHLKWGRLNNPTYKGTWSQTRDTIHMDFPEAAPVGASPVEAMIVGDKISGSWNFGRAAVKWDNGMYAFTVERQGAATVQSSLEGTTWKGDSPSGDKHYQAQFLPKGQVIWNVKWNNYGEAKGFWRQEGNTITLVLDGYLRPVLITLNGDTMNGSWSGGQYKFTLTKVQ